MALPAYASAGTVLGGSNSTTANVAVPSGVAANDVILVFFWVETTQAVTPPAGFTLAPDCPVIVTTNAHRLHIFWKRATGADTGTYAFTVAAGLVWRDAVAVRYTGCITTGNPIDVTNAATRNTATSGVTPAVIDNTLGPDRLLVFAATNYNAGTWTQPSGFTQRANFNGLTTSTKSLAVAASTGSLTATCSTNGSSAAWIGALIPPQSYKTIARSGTSVVGTTAALTVAGVQDGDILICAAGQRGTGTLTTAFTWPTGWTAIAAGNHGLNSTFERLEVRWYLWNTGDPTSHTITGSSFNVTQGYSGVNPNGPILDFTAMVGAQGGTGPTATAAINNADLGAWRVVAATVVDVTQKHVTGATISASGGTVALCSPTGHKDGGSPGVICVALLDSNGTIPATNSTAIEVVSGNGQGLDNMQLTLRPESYIDSSLSTLALGDNQGLQCYLGDNIPAAVYLGDTLVFQP